MFTASRTLLDFHDGYLVWNLFWPYISFAPMDFPAFAAVPKTYFSLQLDKHPFFTVLRTRAYREYLIIFTASRSVFDFHDGCLVYNLWPYILCVPIKFPAYTAVPLQFFSLQLGKHQVFTILRTRAYRKYVAMFTASNTFLDLHDGYLVWNLFWPYILFVPLDFPDFTAVPQIYFSLQLGTQLCLKQFPV